MGSSKKTVAPAPDPRIAEAAVQQNVLGREYLDFSKEQFAAGEKRQDGYDALTGKVADAAMASQAQADGWATEDRAKYGAWADEDRAAGNSARGYFDGLAGQATASGERYETEFGNLGREAAVNGQMYEQIFGKIAQDQSTFGMEEMDRYKSQFRPVQDRIVSDAMGWDSEDRLASESGKAKADVIGNAAQQREASARQMASMGVDPRSGRFAGVDRAGGVQTALAAAGAQNMSRDNVLNQAQTLRGQAGQLGQQVLANGQQANQMSMAAVGAGQAARQSGQQITLAATGASQAARQSGQQLAMQGKTSGLAAAGIGNATASMGNSAALASAGLGLSAGSAATGAAGSANSNFYANNGIMGAGYGAAQAGAAGSAATLNNLYGNNLQKYQIDKQASASKSSGIGSLLGTVGGLGLSAYGMGLFK